MLIIEVFLSMTKKGYKHPEDCQCKTHKYGSPFKGTKHPEDCEHCKIFREIAKRPKVHLKGKKHPPDCNHCLAITGERSFYKNNPHPLAGIPVTGKLGNPVECSKGCGMYYWPRAIWRHEIVCDGTRFDYGPYWDCIRKLIYKRDNYECQSCGIHFQKKKKFVAHHIIAFRIVKEHTEPNLITLCQPCHMVWHRYEMRVRSG